MTDYISPEAQATHAAATAQNNAVESKKKLWNNLFFVLNFPILVAILIGLTKVGFVNIIPLSIGPWNLLITAAIIGLLFMVVRKIAGITYGVFVIFTCCTGLIFLPIYNILVGYASLWVISLVIPSMFQLSSNLLFGILAGLVIGIGQIPILESVSLPALKSIADQMKENKKK